MLCRTVRHPSGVEEMSLKCPGCGMSEFVDDSLNGTCVCTSCGRLLRENMVSEEPEWRQFKEEGSNLSSQPHGLGNAEMDARVNTFTEDILPSTGLSTDFSLNGRPVEGRLANMINNIEGIQQQRQNRKLLAVHSTMQEIGNQLDLEAGVIKRAFTLFCDCYTQMHIRSNRSDEITASCIYLACRLCSAYRLLSEICSVMICNIRKVTRLSQVIISEMKLHVPVPTEEDHIRRYCGALFLPRECASMALKLVAAVKEGQYPNTVSSALNAAMVLMASKICNVEEIPSANMLSLISSKSEQAIVRVYKAVYTHCDAILVSVFRDDPKMTSKAILKLVEKLNPKLL